jgi:hypothetical protein
MASLQDYATTSSGVYYNTFNSPRFEMEYLCEPYQPVERVYVNYDLRRSYREPETITEYMATERELEREQNIMNRLMNLHHDFIRRYGITPNSIFLNREDHHQVMRNHHMNYYGDTNTFNGLRVIPTIADKSYVGLVNLEH